MMPDGPGRPRRRRPRPPRPEGTQTVGPHPQGQAPTNPRVQGAGGGQVGPRRRPQGPRPDASGNGSRAPDSQIETAPTEVAGYVLVRPDGSLSLRAAARPIEALAPGVVPDAAIPPGFSLTRGVRAGDAIVAMVAVNGRYARVTDVLSIDGRTPAEAVARPRFDQLTAIYPNRAISISQSGVNTGRVLELFAPIGFGSRVLIVSPPKAGKTTILRDIALAVIANHPKARVICCLIGERPEEATEFTRTLPPFTATGTPVEIVATTFDDATAKHAAVADLTAERARRLVEDGQDVVLLIDSITRLVRAHNLATTGRNAGRTLSGGVSAGALAPSRRFFGAARATDEGPSLTVIASCLVGTESRQDDVVYEELKGTGNSEIVLSRRLAERRTFPAIDIRATGTRREELLMSPERLDAVHRARRAVIAFGDGPDTMSRLVEAINESSNEEELLRRLSGRPAGPPPTAQRGRGGVIT
jgi:transcription termination factor Rho